MHAGILVQLRLHLVTARPWQRVLVALVLLAIGVAAGLVVFDVVGALVLVTPVIGWWRVRRDQAEVAPSVDHNDHGVNKRRSNGRSDG